MTADMFAVYRTATHEVFRLETLQVYSVEDEADQFRTWKATGKVPRDPAIEESTSAYRQAVARGVRVHRVHVLDLPLTPYLAYELAGYQENTAAGEDVRIAVRSRHEELTNLTRDLALIDPGTDHAAVVWFRYDDGGQVIGRDLSTSPGDVTWAIRARDVALAHAMPLSEFASYAADPGNDDVGQHARGCSD